MLTFVSGVAADVFGPDLARAVDAELRRRFPSLSLGDAEAYRADPVEFKGWTELRKRVPQLASVEPYQAVFLPLATSLENLPIANAADPLQVSSLETLLDGLRAFAAAASLPTDDVELMQLGAKYLEDDALFDSDLDVQTYVQLMLAAKQASARGQGLWIVA